MEKGSKMKASNLILSKDFPHFPELIDYDIPLELLDARVVTTLQKIRYVFGRAMHPTPDKEGWARLDGSKTSQHYAVGRLSKAGDFFPERGYMMECWLVAQQIKDVMGIGLYLDTKGIDGAEWPMMHYDLRNSGKRVFWARDKGEYYTLGLDDEGFWQCINKLIEKDKEFRNGTAP